MLIKLRVQAAFANWKKPKKWHYISTQSYFTFDAKLLNVPSQKCLS